MGRKSKIVKKLEAFEDFRELAMDVLRKGKITSMEMEVETDSYRTESGVFANIPTGFRSIRIRWFNPTGIKKADK